MKRFLQLILISIIPIILFAQVPDGTFKNGSDSLSFEGNKLKFKVSGFSGLTTSQVGEGEFEVIDDFLLVHTTDYSGDKTTLMELDGTRKDTCIVKVITKFNYPAPGILVESLSGSDKIIGAKVTNNEGKVALTEQDKTEKLNVTAMGYDPISFDFNNDKDYLITIAENNIIENQTVVFKFNPVDDETISVLLMTDDFDSGKNLEKELNKLEKRVKRNNLIYKRYTKEIIPIDYNYQFNYVD